MAGLYHNEEHCYVAEDWVEKQADWFEDEEGYLYIIPHREVVADSYGPDTPIEDELNRLMGAKGRITESDCRRLKVVRIPPVLYRFNPVDGYYHA